MRVLLSRSLALEFFGKPCEGNGKSWVDDVGGRPWTAISGIDELDGADCAGQSYGSEIEYAFGIDELAVVERKTVALERAEDLLDAPAQTVELHNFLGLRGGGDRMGREQPPQQGRLAGRSIGLAGLDQREFQGFWSIIQTTGIRTCDAKAPGAQGDLGNTAFIARSAGRHLHRRDGQRRGISQGAKQSPAIGKLTVLRRPHDQIEPRRLAGKEQINVA